MTQPSTAGIRLATIREICRREGHGELVEITTRRDYGARAHALGELMIDPEYPDPRVDGRHLPSSVRPQRVVPPPPPPTQPAVEAQDGRTGASEGPRMSGGSADDSGGLPTAPCGCCVDIPSLPRPSERLIPVRHEAADAILAELDRLRRAVQAVRELCDEAEQDEPSAVFSQGGPVWGVWASDIRQALDGGEQ